jgi:hypothetical protein
MGVVLLCATVSVIACVLCVLLTLLVRHIRVRRAINRVPGPRTAPIVGNALQLRCHPDGECRAHKSDTRAQISLHK